MKKFGLGLFAVLMVLTLAGALYAGSCGTYDKFVVESKCPTVLQYKLVLFNVNVNGGVPSIEKLAEQKWTTRGLTTEKPSIWVSDLSKVTKDTFWQLDVDNARAGAKNHTYKGKIGTGTKITCRPRDFM